MVSRKLIGRRGEGALLTPPKLFKIGEVMRFSGLSRQTVHNYTLLGLIRETERTDSGHRRYPESVFPRSERIVHLKRTKTLREIQEILQEAKAE